MTLVYDNFGNGASYAAMAGGRFWITGIPGKTGWDRTVGGGKMESTVYAINPSVKKILFIGLGTGEELLVLRELYPDAAITVIEVNPDLIEAFREFSYQPIADELKRSKVFLTDGRRFLQTQPAARFDYIHIGVHRASTSGTGNLFSKDFLATLKGHLSPGGVVTFYAYPPVVSKRAVNPS